MVTAAAIAVLLAVCGMALGQFDASTCGIEKGCIMQPAGCDPMANCYKAFSYQMDGDYLNIELVGQENSHDAWVAVGFSTDRKMGGDTVTECSNFRDSPLQGRLSYNPGKQNSMLSASEEDQAKVLLTRSAMFSNGRIYCSLRQLLVPPNTLQTTQVQRLARSFYILLATGATSKNAKIMHSLDPSHVSDYPFISGEKIDLTEFGTNATISGGNFAPFNHKQQQSGSLQFTNSPGQTFSPNGGGGNIPGLNVTGRQLVNNNNNPNAFNQNIPGQNFPNQQFAAPLNQGISPAEYNSRLVKAHAICMLFSFLTFLATGILFARYFRSHCPNSKICGLLIWFHLHRTLNLIAIAGTICGFVCIMISRNWQWVGPSPANSTEENEQWASKHAMVGLLALVIAWAQPLNATFRCHPESRARIIFNLYHWFFGTAAWTLGATAIVIAIVHFEDLFKYPRVALGFIIGYLVALGVTLIINELLLIYQWTQRRNNVASSDMEMIQVNGKTRVTLSPQSSRVRHVPELGNAVNLQINAFRIVILLLFLIAAIGCPVVISALIGIVPGPDSQNQ